MTIDREVISDLMPLYRSGLASEASRRLIETWLAEHPSEQFGEAAGRIERGGGYDLEAFARARRLRRWQRRLYGLAVGLTLLCFTAEFHFTGGRLASARLLALYYPLAFAPLIAGAVAAWAGYLWMRRRLR